MAGSRDASPRERQPSGWCPATAAGRRLLWLAGLVCLLLIPAAARADRVPADCNGSGLGITLFTSIPDVHIGDTLKYSINVFNGIPNSGRIVCDATGIQAFIVTPDGKTNNIALVRTTLHQAEADFYPDVVSYVVRPQDIQADGTLLATARDIGTIHQNDVNSIGGGFQGLNTEVNMPCALITALCVGGVGENGAITFTGTVTNCGNNTLVGVVVTNFVNGQAFPVLFPTNLALGQSVNFSGSWVPANPCVPSTAILSVRATDQFTATPQTVTNIITITCQNTLTPGIKVTKVCPTDRVGPGQPLTFSGSVSNTGNITLTNVVVVNNQPAANTVVFTLASLGPGAVANFTASYPAPTSCFVTDTLTASATSRCGVFTSSFTAPADACAVSNTMIATGSDACSTSLVTNSVSATCPLVTTPRLIVTQTCPANPASLGGCLPTVAASAMRATLPSPTCS